MLHRSSIGAVAVALATALTVTIGIAQAADEAKYPDWTGAWARFVVRGLGGQPSFDQTKPWGFGQEAPLTPEYKKVLEARWRIRPMAVRAILRATPCAFPAACRL